MAWEMAEALVERAGSQSMNEIFKRINIPTTPTSPAGLIEANTLDPFKDSGKYALGWTYFCLVLLMSVTVTRCYHLWTDKLRQAMHKHEVEEFYQQQYYAQEQAYYAQENEYAMGNMQSAVTADPLFQPVEEKDMGLTRGQSRWSSIGFVNDTLALFRWIFYRPIPALKWKKTTLVSFPSLSVVILITIAVSFVTLYCFLPQPLFWQSIQYGSPPLAIRAGMLAIAMTPWIVATSMKANIISFMTGIGHDRLNVLHRWGGYLCLFLSIVHVVPFYITPVWEDGGMSVFYKLFPDGSGMIYGTGIACLVPLGWLCIGSLPILRSLAYEVFVTMHTPVAIAYVGLLFWHTKNYLTSWHYLWATVIIWALCYFGRMFKLNWFKPWRNAWLIGDEAAVTLMAENAIKVTIPTQMKWKPGQYCYLRMPGISIFENHPFTIASLCSEDFPSEYGEQYRDCTLVFRPFGGFTRKVLDTAVENGPFKTYRAYVDGPYGGMQRELAAFETVILFAGGSGITAIVSQLLNLIKRMRDGKAVTKKIEVVWALKRLEAMDWFREELRICREYAPPDTVTCQFYVTATKRQTYTLHGMSERRPRPISMALHDKLDGFVAGIASKRNSALIEAEAQGDYAREQELRAEDQDAIHALPHQKYLQPRVITPKQQMFFPPPPTKEIRESTLKKLIGKEELQHTPQPTIEDQHLATHRYLSPNRASGHFSRPGDFHFPPPSPNAHSPHFNYAPPSAKRNSQNYDYSNRNSAIYDSSNRHSYDPANLPPPPPGPPPNTFSPAEHAPRGLGLAHAPPTQDYKHSGDYVHEEDEIKHDLSVPPAAHTRQKSNDLHIQIPTSHPTAVAMQPPPPTQFLHPQSQPQQPQDIQPQQQFDFGFPSTPTEFQKNLMRFAFVAPKKKEGWTTEYGRPDLGFMLKEWATGGADGKGIFGRRTCVFVCGPPAMRVDVANTVARLQADIWGDDGKDEIFLHTENYAV